jgi:hypothetical protein
VRIKKILIFGVVLILPLMFLWMSVVEVEGVTDKPIIVCTTSAVGSIETSKGESKPPQKSKSF